jgi:hypothetical protein
MATWCTQETPSHEPLASDGPAQTAAPDENLSGSALSAAEATEVPDRAASNTLYDSSASADFFSLFQDLEQLEVIEHDRKTVRHIKEWTFITYMAADNDLAHFARRNLVQQTAYGSNEMVNIVTQLDTRAEGNKKITKRYFIERGKLILTNMDEPTTQRMDSGNPQTLIDCVRWAVRNYPARHYALILWNHGTGIIDIARARMINPSNLFNFNPNKGIFELDRSIHFLDLIEALQAQDQRGICFDDSTGHYLNNQDLEFALSTICSTLLQGKKLDIIAFDACLMSMLEVANIVKKYAHYMAASQEVELGTGYNYQTVLLGLEEASDARTFAQNIVTAYDKTYERVTGDYTQSALDLSAVDGIENNVNAVADLLLSSLKYQKNNSAAEAIKTSKHKLLCTHFDEPSYIDLHHFYNNLLSNLKLFVLESSQMNIVSALKHKLQEGITLVEKMVVANATGKNLKKARGVSIYFPDRRIHGSYQKTNFATSNKWYTFLRNYVK